MTFAPTFQMAYTLVLFVVSTGTQLVLEFRWRYVVLPEFLASNESHFGFIMTIFSVAQATISQAPAQDNGQ